MRSNTASAASARAGRKVADRASGDRRGGWRQSCLAHHRSSGRTRVALTGRRSRDNAGLAASRRPVQDYALSHASFKLRAPGTCTQAGRQGVTFNAARTLRRRVTCSPPPLSVATGQRPLIGRDVRSVARGRGGEAKWWGVVNGVAWIF